jgi:hypothetical protein
MSSMKRGFHGAPAHQRSDKKARGGHSHDEGAHKQVQLTSAQGHRSGAQRREAAASLAPLSLGASDPYLNGVGTIPLKLFPLSVSELYPEAGARLRSSPSLFIGLDCCAVCAAPAAQGEERAGCDRCQRVDYCSHAHRRKDRRIHAAVCDALCQLNQDIAFARDAAAAASGAAAAPASATGESASQTYDPNDVHVSGAAAAFMFRAVLLGALHETRLRGFDSASPAPARALAALPGVAAVTAWAHWLPFSFGVAPAHWTWESLVFAPLRLAARAREGPLPAPRAPEPAAAAEEPASEDEGEAESSPAVAAAAAAAAEVALAAVTAELMSRPRGSLSWAVSAPALRALTARLCCPLTVARAVAATPALAEHCRAVLTAPPAAGAGADAADADAGANADANAVADAGAAPVAGVDAPARTLLVHVVGAAELESLPEVVAFWAALPQALARQFGLPLLPTPLYGGVAAVAADEGDETGDKRQNEGKKDKKKKAGESAGDSAAAVAASAARAIAAAADWRVRIVFIGPEIPHHVSALAPAPAAAGVAPGQASYTALLPAASPHLDVAFYRGTYDAFLAHLDAHNPLPQSLLGPVPIPPRAKPGAAPGAAPASPAAPAGPVQGSVFSFADTRPDLVCGFQMGLTVDEYDWGATLSAFRGLTGTSRVRRWLLAREWAARFPLPTAAPATGAPARKAEAELSDEERTLAAAMARRSVAAHPAMAPDERRRWVLATSSSEEEALREASILTGQCGFDAVEPTKVNTFAALQPLQSATLANDVWYKNAYVTLYTTGTTF